MAVQEIPQHLADLRATFRSGRTRPMAWRRTQLKRLKALLKENEQALADALHADLRKSFFESWSGEINFTVNEIDHSLAHMEDWARPRPVDTPIAFQPASSEVRKEPLGVSLIIGPWNYPVQLILAPLAAALSAGNCAVLKPSEVAEHTAEVLARLIPSYMDPDAVRVVTGSVPETTALLEQRFDHIFFTGSTAVGRIVMQAAAKHLTPVTLELGGKSPCIVAADAPMKVAARRILWGKLYNAGQTCVAPDYVLVERGAEGELLDAIRATLQDFYGPTPQRSADLARIINERHFDRLQGLLEGQDIAVGGGSDRADLFIEPTVVTGVDPESPLMQEEIFGPILPIVPWDTLQEAIDFVNDREKPLALYVFTRKKATAEAVLNNTSSGGAAVNCAVMHLAVPDLPFGGVGPSGMGAYHGQAGFDCFSHTKSVFSKTTLVDPPVLYPPYTAFKKKVTRTLL
jgi:aldehyde dehydrogenase (NAD+)